MMFSLRTKLLLIIKDFKQSLLCILSNLKAPWQAASVVWAVRSRSRQFAKAMALQDLLTTPNFARVFTSTRSRISYTTSSGSLSSISAAPVIQKVQALHHDKQFLLAWGDFSILFYTFLRRLLIQASMKYGNIMTKFKYDGIFGNIELRQGPHQTHRKYCDMENLEPFVCKIYL